MILSGFADEPRRFCCPCGSSALALGSAASDAAADAAASTGASVAAASAGRSIAIGVTTGLIVWTLTRWLDRRRA